MLAVHRSRFVHASSSTIVHIASLGKLIAVARSNGNIELWTDMYHSQTISGSPANPIESLVLVKGHEGPRLFAAGLEGVIIDYCLTSLGQKYVAHSMGGPIWCMRLDPTGKTLAIGCEDGACRLFEITQTGLEFKSSIERQKSRVMSLAWHPCGTKLALGSIKGSIRTVCCKTTRTITRMTVDSRSDEKTVIWDLLCLADGTIVSADSLGNVSFFDFDGAIIRLVKGHEADVLCLAANAAGTRVFSSGVDRKILEITNDAGEWIVSGQKRYHSHDVRALFYREQRPYDQLISGGVDNSLIFSGPCTEFETMKQQRMPTYPHKAPVSIARNARLVLARFEDNLKLWMFGTFRESGQQVVDHQRLEGTHHRHLLTVNFKVIWSLTQGKHNIVASAISDDGKWICASDGLENRLYHLVYDEFSIPTVKRVHDLPQIAAAHQILFTRNSQTLVLGCSDSNVYLISLDSRSIALEYGFHRDGREPNGVWTRAGITSLATSFDGQWLVVGDSLNRHSVVSLDTLQVYHCLM